MIWLPAALRFTFLPESVDMGFVGTGSALGGVVAGLYVYFRGAPLQEIAERAAGGALALGTVACIVWLAGLAGIRFE